MKLMRVPKRNGSYRTVCCPSRAEKIKLRAMLPRLTAAALMLDVHGVQHGFSPARSPVTCAAVHVGRQFTVSFDLSDCFDHVTRAEAVKTVPWLADTAYNLAFNGGVARQGLPTSPAICNIVLAHLDAEIVGLLAGRGVYTRYADDLTISFDDESLAAQLVGAVPELVAKYGQQINPNKTTVQRAASGRRIITGVAVDESIQPTRESKRRLRAARHRQKWGHARGLAEWCRLKRPDLGRCLTAYLMADNDSEHNQSCARLVARREADGATRPTRKAHHL